jgi:high-affinity nickel-transport protein
MLAALTACLLGFGSGLRHALEPDHIAAVSTFVAGAPNRRASVRYAASWGAGHGTMLVLAGGALALFRFELPSVAGDVLELAVAVVLAALGVRGLRSAIRAGRGGERFAHAHGDRAHAHAGARDHVHVRGVALARLPFAVGLVHGLAGSGAIAAIVASRLASAASVLAFIGIYAAGAALGMAALAGALGWPLSRLARSRGGFAVVVGASAALSLAVGVAWAAPIVLRLAS